MTTLNHDRLARARSDRAWVGESLKVLADERRTAGETPLREFPLPGLPNIRLLIKDETSQPTGSLKHRLARALMSYGLVNGKLKPNVTIVEASSGSTAVSEAYFAQLLGLRFIAVIPRGTSPGKIAEIEKYGGECHKIAAPAELRQAASELADSFNGYFVDQFANASAATDWRQDNLPNVVMAQCELLGLDAPKWLVTSAGTGGTITSFGRYCRLRSPETYVALADPEGSAYHPAWRDGRRDVTTAGSIIEGIGRPRVEPACELAVIDRAFAVPDYQSFAACALLYESTGIFAGGSSGTNLVASLHLAAEMSSQGVNGTIVSLACDRGDRYLDTYHSSEWLAASGYDVSLGRAELEAMAVERLEIS